MISFIRKNGYGVLLIAVTYLYFLLFAEFAFIELFKADFDISIKPVMAAMAICGIVGSLISPFILKRLGVSHALTIALVGCGAMGLLAPTVHSFSAYLLISSGIGIFLGVLTVSLTASLGNLLQPDSWGISIGLGTGIAYFLANVPIIFNAAPAYQSLMCGLLPLAAVTASISQRAQKNTTPPKYSAQPSTVYFSYAILVFLALVWLDSAAFFIIQHTPQLKANSWGDGDLWRNGLVHLIFGILSGLLLQKGRFQLISITAFILLALASLALNSEQEIAMAGGWLYPAGVSLYSAALIACPAYLIRSKSPAWAAAILYAIAGWFGSANGIGMAEHLNRIPISFILIAGLIIALPILKRYKPAALLSIITICYGYYSYHSQPVAKDSYERGRQVYLSEGCINCHSRYVRPDTSDVEYWGPVVDLSIIKKDAPVMIGNRRNGPDLLNIGNRRSQAWLKQHFIAPRSLSLGSAMPSYQHLFENGNTQGDDLITFIIAQGVKTFPERNQYINQWRPKPDINSSSDAGQKLFAKLCIACHGHSAQGDGSLSHLWVRPPTNLIHGPFAFSQDLENLPKIIKFGIPGTDMPGHETLPDKQIQDIVAYLKILRAAPRQ